VLIVFGTPIISKLSHLTSIDLNFFSSFAAQVRSVILVPKKLDTIDFRQHTQQETRQLLKKVLGYSDKEAKLLSFEIYNNQDNLVIKHTDLDKILAKAKKNINNI